MPENEQNDPPMLHRDDVPMDVAEHMVSKMKEVYGDIQVRFIGDSTEELPQELKDAHKKIYEHLAHCFVNGLCHVCGTKFPGDWPPTEEKDWNLNGWAYYDTDQSSEPPMLVCPKCEDDESDGIPRPVEIPDV